MPGEHGGGGARQVLKIDLVVLVVSFGVVVSVPGVAGQLPAPSSVEPDGSSGGVEKGFECWDTGGYDADVGFEAEWALGG